MQLLDDGRSYLVSSPDIDREMKHDLDIMFENMTDPEARERQKFKNAPRERARFNTRRFGL